MLPPQLSVRRHLLDFALSPVQAFQQPPQQPRALEHWLLHVQKQSRQHETLSQRARLLAARLATAHRLLTLLHPPLPPRRPHTHALVRQPAHVLGLARRPAPRRGRQLLLLEPQPPRLPPALRGAPPVRPHALAPARRPAPGLVALPLPHHQRPKQLSSSQLRKLRCEQPLALERQRPTLAFHGVVPALLAEQRARMPRPFRGQQRGQRATHFDALEQAGGLPVRHPVWAPQRCGSYLVDHQRRCRCHGTRVCVMRGPRIWRLCVCERRA